MAHVETSNFNTNVSQDTQGVNTQSMQNGAKNAQDGQKSFLPVAIEQQEQAEKISDIRGEIKDINFGSQIRSYVMQPYTLVKDHRTNAEVGNVAAVLDGDLAPLVNAYLHMKAKE